MPGNAVQPDAALRTTRPGETLFWCSCDPDRQQPYLSSGELVRHVMESRASDAGHGDRAGEQT
jgi:hypothetical protein